MQWVVILFFILTTGLVAETRVSGEVSGEWDRDGAPYIVTDDISVDDELVIDAGVDVVFEWAYRFVVSGSVVARGDEDNPITFTSDGDVKWRSIRLLSPDGGCEFSYCIFEESEVVGRYNHRDSRGGAIYGENCDDILIENCTIRDCEGTGQGVITFYHSQGEIRSNHIHDNETYTEIVVLESSDIAVVDNLIEDNVSAYGAGVYILHESPDVSGNIVRYNESDMMQWGCGLYFEGSRSRVYSNLVHDNRGGGVYIGVNSVIEEFERNVIYNNPGRCGIILSANGRVTVKNSVLWEHNDPVWEPAGSITADYSLIQNYQQECDDVGEGMLDEEPRFVDPEHGDFHLAEDSPCIDAGDPDSPADWDGSRADIGLDFGPPPRNVTVTPERINFGYVAFDIESRITVDAIYNSDIEDPPPIELTPRIELGGEWLSVGEGGELAAEDTLAIEIRAHADPDDSVGWREGLVVITPDDEEIRPTELPVYAFFIEGFGSLAGRVVDAESGRPLFEAPITIGDIPSRDPDDPDHLTSRRLTTDPRGGFALSPIPAWNYTTTLQLPDYMPHRGRVRVLPGGTSSVLIRMRYSDCRVAEEALFVDCPYDSSITVPLNITNPGNGTLHYSLAKRFPNQEDGLSEIARVPVGEVTGDRRLLGVEFVGERLYVSGGDNGQGLGRIYVFDRDGELIDVIDQPRESGWGMRDLSWDGQLLWGAIGDVVYGMNLSGEVQWTIIGPYEVCRALTWDAEGILLWVGDGTQDILGISDGGEVLETVSNPGYDVRGLAYFEDDPDNHRLYAFCRTDDDLATIYKVDQWAGEWVPFAEINLDSGMSAGGLFISHDWTGRSWVIGGLLTGGEDGEPPAECRIWRLPAFTVAEPWEQRAMWDVETTCRDSRLQGVACDGENFYLSGGNDGEGRGRIYVLNRYGRIFRYFNQFHDSEWGMRDLTWGAGLLWGADGRMVYAFTTGGDLERQFDVPLDDIYGIAWDPERELLWLCGEESDVLGVDMEGSVLARVPREQVVRIQGLATNPDDADGASLYAFCRSGVRDLQVRKVNPDGGDWEFAANLDLPDDYQSGGACITSRWDPMSTVFAGLVKGTGENRDHLALFQLSPRRDWLRFGDDSGFVPPRRTVPVPVLFDVSGIRALVEFEADIIIRHNGRGGEVVVPVFMQTVEPDAIPPGKPLNPSGIRLHKPRPNPFNSTTVLRFDLPRRERVSLRLYDLSGRMVRVLYSGILPEGSHEVNLDAGRLPSGVYLVRLDAGNGSQTVKAVVMR